MPVISRPFSPVQPQQVEGLSTFGEAFRAATEETFATGPLGSLNAFAEINAAEGGIWGYGRDRELSQLLTPEAATQRVKDAGLEGHVPLNKYPGGIREETLGLLIQMNQDKVRRQTLAAEYDGWSPQVAGMLVGSLIDPVNIGLSFVPVVGEARYAKLLANASGRLGRTGVRATVGALEGTAGAIVAEPLIYAGQQQWRNDYDAYDSMLNIAGGAVFGSLLHAGAGLVRDAFGNPIVHPALEAEVRDVRERLALPPPERQFADWMRPMDVDRASVEARLRTSRPVDRAEALPEAAARLRQDMEADLLARASAVAEPGTVAAARQDLTTAQWELGKLESQRRDIIQERNAQPGVTRKQAERLADEQIADAKANLEGRIARAEQIIESNRQGSQAVAELSALRKRGEIPESWRARVEAEADRTVNPDAAAPRATEADPFAGVRPFVAALDQDTQAASLRQAVAQALRGQPVEVTSAMLSDPLFRASPEAYRSALERAKANAVQVDGANVRASQAAEERVSGTTQADPAQQAREQLDEELARLRERGEELDAVEEDDLRLTTAAVKAATMCMMRTGG